MRESTLHLVGPAGDPPGPEAPEPAAPAPAADAVTARTRWWPSDPTSAVAARIHVLETLNGWTVDTDTMADAVLLTSELVTNVVMHGDGRQVGVEIEATTRRITVTVHESGASPLSTATAQMLAASGAGESVGVRTPRGRGLAILEALAGAWGISRTAGTTAVWFALAPRTPLPLHAVSPDDAVLLEAVRAGLRRTQLLLRVTEGLAGATSADEVCRALTRPLRRHLAAAFTGIALLEAGDGGSAGVDPWLRFVGLEGLPAESRREWERFRLSAPTALSAAVRTSTASYHADRDQAETQHPGVAAQMAAAGLHASAQVPLVAAGRVVGALSVAWDRPYRPDPDTEALLAIVAGYAAQAVARLPGFAGSGGADDLPGPGCEELAELEAEFDAALDDPAVSLQVLQNLDAMRAEALRRHAHGPSCRHSSR